METLEQLARITLVARLLGGPQLLTQADVDRLAGLRARAGSPDPVCAPGEARPAAVPPRPEATDTVALTRSELLRLITEAVERFRA